MFEIGILNTIFECVALLCIPFFILTAIKGKNPLLWILTATTTIVFIINLLLAVDHHWIAFLSQTINGWSDIHAYVLYGTVILDVVTAVALIFVRKVNLNKKLLRAFVIANLITVIVCNVYNFYTGAISYNIIDALATDTAKIIEYVALIGLYLRLLVTAGGCATLFFVKDKQPEVAQPKETPAESNEPKEETMATETIVDSTTDEKIEEKIEEIVTEEPVIEEPIAEETTVEETTVKDPIVEEQPAEETQPIEQIEQVEETEQVEEVEKAEETITEEIIVEEVEQTEQIEETEQTVIEELEQLEQTEQLPDSSPTEDEDTSSISNFIEQLMAEDFTFDNNISNEQLAIKNNDLSIATTASPQPHQRKPAKKLSRAMRKVRRIQRFVSYINESQAERQIPNMFCRSCGTRTHSQSKICPRCFNRMSPLYKCPRCSTLNETRLCTNCGTKMPRRR